MMASGKYRRLVWVVLIIELAFVLTSVVVALGQGWDQVAQPLQLLVAFIIATVFVLLYEEFWKNYEDQRKQHPGTHHEIRT